MENIKLTDILKSSIAIDTNIAIDISNIISKELEKSKENIILDFSGIKVIIGEFVRILVKPLINNNISFSAINFSSKRIETKYNNIIEEYYCK